MSKKGEYQIPFINNRPLTYAWRGMQGYGGRVEWRDNYEFEATLEFVAMTRGQSAARFVLQDDEGIRYEMFMTDMLRLVQTTTIDQGKVSGRWTFQKRGANIGIRLCDA